MKYAISGALLAGLAAAAPLIAERQSTDIDTTVLQFALTLEHLENVFYKEALKNFTEEDFANAGYGADYYNNLKYIAHDEEVHVQALTAALTAAGVTPNAACEYSFPPLENVLSFVTLSSILEGVGTSAYLGGAPLITSKDYLTVAGSILVTEALHTSMQRGAVNEVPAANPFGTPLDPTSVYSLAAAFISTCPSTNMALPFTPFPSLAVNGTLCTCEEPNCGPAHYQRRALHDGHGNYESWETTEGSEELSNDYKCSPPKAGSTVTFTAATEIPAGSYVTFVNGLNIVSVEGTEIEGENISAVIPDVIAGGQTYVLISNADQEKVLSDAAVLFGPAILEVYPAEPSIDYTVMKL